MASSFEELIKQASDLHRNAWRVALRTAMLPVSTLVRRRDRHLLWKLSEVCFGGQRPGVYQEVAFAELLSDAHSIKLECLRSHSYNVTETELLVIAALTQETAARVAFEIGTANGRTALNMANNISSDGTVFTLNLPQDQDPGHQQDVPVGYHFLGKQTPGRVHQLWGDSKSFDFSPYVGTCQIVFVDGDHFEPGVSTDSNTAVRLVDRQNGIVLWHDALRFHVQTALPRLAKTQNLPIYLISGTNLAALFFWGGRAVPPLTWVSAHSAN
jgi:hypothetical protein